MTDLSWYWEGVVPYRYSRETFGRFFETYDDLKEELQEDLQRNKTLYRRLASKICIEMNCFSGGKKRYEPKDFIFEDNPAASLNLITIIRKDFPRNIVLARIAFLFSVFLRDATIALTIGKLLTSSYLTTYIDDLQQIESRLILANRYYYAPSGDDEKTVAVPKKHLDKYAECVNYYAHTTDSIIDVSTQLRELSRQITSLMRTIVVSPPV